MAADYALKGMLQTALAQCDSAVAPAPQRPDAAESCGWIYARAGRSRQVLDLLRGMNSPTHRYLADPLDIAKVHQGLGDPDRAISTLSATGRSCFRSRAR